MNLLATLKVAMRALARNRLRSLLTMLGIIIGIAAFVAMVATGEGMTEKVRDELSSLGANVVFLSPASVTRAGATSADQRARLYVADADAIAELDDVWLAAPVVRGQVQVVWGANNWATGLVGTTPDYFRVRDWPMAQGAGFGRDEVQAAATVCVLGQTVVTNLFDPGMDPVGETVRVAGVSCQVVGVLEERGSNPFGADEDDFVMMPITTAQRRVLGMDPRLTSFIAVSVLEAERTEAAKQAMTELLRERHRLTDEQEDDFVIRDPKALSQRITAITVQLTIGVGILALISLVVGGIGIMNIMLVSVTERTREIGVRIALGAQSGDILAQFVVESVVLSLVGGALGTGLGVWASTKVATLLEVTPAIDPGSIVLALLFAAAVGLVFGIYPALRASRLDPIEALRYE